RALRYSPFPYTTLFRSQSYGAFASSTPTPIPGPAPLVVSGVTANTVSLTWNDIYDDEDGFLLTRWDNIGNMTTFQFGPNVTSYQIGRAHVLTPVTHQHP